MLDDFSLLFCLVPILSAGVPIKEPSLIKLLLFPIAKEQFFDPENPDNRLNVVLRLDRNLTVQQMVDVMEIGANLGIRMVLATDKSRK